MTGFEFRRARIDARLSVRKCAEVLGVAPRTISRWEADENPIPSEHAEHIAQLAAGASPADSALAETLGRLYAVLEGVIGPERIGDLTTALAMNQPYAVYPKLIQRAHQPENATKLRAVDEQIVALVDRIPATGFPRLLGLADQGAWQLGYYHQRAGKGAGLVGEDGEG